MLAGRVAQKTLLGMRFQPDSPRQWLIRMPPKKYTRRAICNKKIEEMKLLGKFTRLCFNLQKEAGRRRRRNSWWTLLLAITSVKSQQKLSYYDSLGFTKVYI